jgi:glyoxylase-like metal-dependent hydrolase (beta-lactamase superfamily II)
MNAQEHELLYPLADTLPEPGKLLEIAPGVMWLRMPLPFVLDHINLWLLRDALDGREGWTAVDCGIDKPEVRALWDQIIDTQLEGLPILRVVVTHMHPDHIGLAHWLCARFEARLWISATDFQTAGIASQSTTGQNNVTGGSGAADFFAEHGLVDPESLDKIRARANYFPSLVPAVPRQYRRLMDGASLNIGGHGWQCIAGYGHAPEHISLFRTATETSPAVLISGDMMLPRISTNVSVYDSEPEANPLPLFLHSIDRFNPLPGGTLVLPSHGKPFKGLKARIAQLHAHHRDRLAEVLEACAQGPQTAASIVPVLFKRSLDLHQTTFAMGEALAHLHALWFEGRIARSHEGAQWVFRASEAS